MTSDGSKTIRLAMPQWQGGNNRNYPLGTDLLAFLAPDNGQPTLTVEVEPFDPDDTPERGIAHRRALLDQLRRARAVLDDAQPDKVVVFGGDCLVEQAPFSYLNERHGGKLGVLWIDAHPDIKTPAEWANAHTMVLGNLLGEGDAEFSAEVQQKIEPGRVMYAGLREVGLTEQESEVIGRLGLRVASPEALAVDSSAILTWIREEGIDHLAIHLDVDVLDPASFRSVLFAEPDPEINWLEMYPAGKMTLPQVIRVMADAASQAEVVGLGICEHLPWDMIHLKEALAKFPVIS
ncbi:arginase family protein [Mycobacterium sp. ITM-2016-00316]|uniref:arginase family protein n=1 Tax=Mycobacterium sp. ITM-2016-00316 TaxID=2099695 RepID=UPI0018EBB02D|nr:arginase family protein [Mycobacterium sp. ITM-2016-00316]WNG82091.1 arginase family protein [Mycobacterium sp. ITM-2016-00316]